MRTYKIGFALTTALGNRSRFLNLQKYVDQHKDVEATWCPISHYLAPDPFFRWPRTVHAQRVLNHQSAAVWAQWSKLDAVVVHAFQLFALMALYRRFRGGPLLALYQDYAPFRDPGMLQMYGQDIRDGWKHRMRFAAQAKFAREADLYFPWTDWAAQSLVRDCRVDPSRVHTINPGADLSLWPYHPFPKPTDQANVRLLFVGGDFDRKGGKLLLQILPALPEHIEVDVVTRQPLAEWPSRVRVHTDLGPNDPRLRRLYRECDVFVLPTFAEMAGLVFVEAMATGRPVIATSVGGVPDIVRHGQDGLLVKPGDADGLATAVSTLISDPQLRRWMGANARARAAGYFDAGANAGRMLSLLREAVDGRRSRRGRLAWRPTYAPTGNYGEGA